MKNIIVLLGSLLMASTSFAATVRSATIVGDELTVMVRHGGGCGEHTYDLKLEGCAESMPVQCQATIVHRSNDPCEAIISREAKFSLKKLGLTDAYYANGSLTIKGDQGSKATVTIPAASDGSVNCVTHTGSDLKIDAKKKLVTLKSTAGVTQKYKIVKFEMMSIETFPAIDQSTYTLDDKRKIVTEFRGDEVVGTGYFIRVTGDSSPEFECKL